MLLIKIPLSRIEITPNYHSLLSALQIDLNCSQFMVDSVYAYSPLLKHHRHVYIEINLCFCSHSPSHQIFWSDESPFGHFIYSAYIEWVSIYLHARGRGWWWKCVIVHIVFLPRKFSRWWWWSSLYEIQ